jgi:predicted Zn-dependent protease
MDLHGINYTPAAMEKEVFAAGREMVFAIECKRRSCLFLLNFVFLFAMNRFRFFLIAILSAVILLPGCESTTAGGATGSSRSQFMLISSATINEAAAQAYVQELNKARSAKVLNTNVAETRRVNAIAHRLIAQVGTFRADALDWNWEVNVIEDKEINAYCMPGGKIVIYTGIIQELKLTDDELAAVIGHEMAHALREHTREKISQQVAASQAINIGFTLLGAGGQTASLANVASEYMLVLPFSRRMELEADVIGMELMARAGFNPEGAVKVWQKMAALSGNARPPEFLSTHPIDSTRIANLQNELPKVMPLYAQAKQKGATPSTR